MEKQNISYLNDIKELENLKVEDKRRYHDLEVECADNMDRINQLVSDNQHMETINNEKKRQLQSEINMKEEQIKTLVE